MFHRHLTGQSLCEDLITATGAKAPPTGRLLHEAERSRPNARLVRASLEVRVAVAVLGIVLQHTSGDLLTEKLDYILRELSSQFS
jgi:hypothetical protein